MKRYWWLLALLVGLGLGFAFGFRLGLQTERRAIETTSAEPLVAPLTQTQVKGVTPVLAPGNRAVSLRVVESPFLWEFVQPDERVDVIVRKTADDGSTTYRPVVENVRLLPVGTEHPPRSYEPPRGPCLATLGLSPEQAEAVKKAAKEGG
jgi:Flp pilus assembly protein CpaB